MKTPVNLEIHTSAAGRSYFKLVRPQKTHSSFSILIESDYFGSADEAEKAGKRFAKEHNLKIEWTIYG